MTTVKNAQYEEPRHLIVTVYGLYAREEHNWLPIAGVVRLLADLGVDGPAVRSSISRLKRRDTVRALRLDGAAGYALSPPMLSVLWAGDRRIFDVRPPSLADGWVQVVFTVPEAERVKRHELRTSLSRLGFGPVAPGVWIAPGGLVEEVESVLTERGLGAYVDLFRAEHLGYTPLASRVREWWDLDALGAAYAEFLARWRPVRRRVSRRAPGEADAFAEYVRMLTGWRRLRYLDPGLPAEVLPTRWPGVAAASLFAELNGVLRPVAHRHAQRVLHG